MANLIDRLTTDNAQENVLEAKENEYLKDGLPYCKTCNEPKYFDYNGKIVNAVCSCFTKQQEEEAEREARTAKEEIILKLKEKSLLGKMFKNARFENLDPKRDNDLMEIVDRTKLYVENFKAIKEEGQGIYIFGDVGTGKSYLTACIGNELMDNGYSVLFTNFSEISKMIRETYDFDSRKSESEVLRELTDVDLLIIDDLGTEKNITAENSFLQEKVFEVINNRYINKKSIIFTSNYSISDLYNRGVEERTVDRISEMSTVNFRVKGISYRVKARNAPLF
ncbi:MAG TPA: ATP-binding protein [Edaphocola sp.]|nr:ATP-binding protein [Edaphocola sp.]